MVVNDDIIFVFNIGINLFGFTEELERVILGLFEESGDAFKVFFILNMVVEFVFDFAFFDEFGYFIVVVDFLNVGFFVHFLKDELLDDLFLVVLFFVLGFDRLPLVL
jgi:hypothetical protein